MFVQQRLQENHGVEVDRDTNFSLSPYPVDLSPFLLIPSHGYDTQLHVHGGTIIHDPTILVQYALAHWNQYLISSNEHHRDTFLLQAHRLAVHAVRIGDDAVGWPVSLVQSKMSAQRLALSATVQGCALSVLLRAYQLTRDDMFIEVAQRALRTFERDILDGGISTPLGEDGVFFEEVAVYPATHALSGFIFAIIGLYEYQACTYAHSMSILLQRSLATLHRYIDEFDHGYWTHTDLLHRSLASPSHLALQVRLLEALAACSGCNHCSALASQWRNYLHRRTTHLRSFLVRHCTSLGRRLLDRVRPALFPAQSVSPLLRVCIALPTFPITGGILTFLEGIAQVTADIWQLEYVTQCVGPQHPERFVIHPFGTAKMTPWLFPGLWLYFIAGFRKLMVLLHRGAAYHIILPQDAIFTGAFTALAAKLAGIHVVCIDHGDLTLLHSYPYRIERLNDLANKHWPPLFRLLMQQLLVCYWPSRFIQAWIAARFIDHFLIPGFADDGIEEVCTQLGIPRSRITRFASMLDIARHGLPDASRKANMRQQKGIAADAIVIALACRLAPEKGLDIAVESVSTALSRLPYALRRRVQVIIAGDGPLRERLETSIRTHGISQECTLWGDIAVQEVPSLLAMSDIFLYTSVRGACLPMAILEAMASACAVIASTQPVSNATLLAQGRGIAVPPGDIAQTSEALVRLMSDGELCKRMGMLARDYVMTYHSPVAFRRALLRVTSWAALDELLGGTTETLYGEESRGSL
jgi:glycosyltransferase involved in cell wall biosynthesis